MNQIYYDRDRILLRILSCAEKTSSQVGRQGMMKILLGERSKRLAKYGFDHLEEFGSLIDVPGEVVLGHIDMMIERGCITISGLFFPMLSLTELGRKRLDKLLSVNG